MPSNTIFTGWVDNIEVKQGKNGPYTTFTIHEGEGNTNAWNLFSSLDTKFIEGEWYKVTAKPYQREYQGKLYKDMHVEGAVIIEPTVAETRQMRRQMNAQNAANGYAQSVAPQGQGRPLVQPQSNPQYQQRSPQNTGYYAAPQGGGPESFQEDDIPF